MNATDQSRPAVDPNVNAIRQRVAGWRRAGERIALVPTMGALHDGHLALIRDAGKRADRTVVSIFLNPTQFAPSEDLATYPKTWEDDLAAVARLGADAVFAPNVEEMYPDGFATSVTVAGPGLGLETDFRPQFLTGVATVVSKLLIACAPDIAIFGEKDYQQLLVIQRMVVDLRLPIDIVGHPTMREPDGLALSSRNTYLSAEERRTAPTLYRTLSDTAAAIRLGRSAEEAVAAACATLAGAGFAIDYLALRNAETLAPVLDARSEPCRLLAAARLGRTRLIDNLTV